MLFCLTLPISVFFIIYSYFLFFTNIFLCFSAAKEQKKSTKVAKKATTTGAKVKPAPKQKISKTVPKAAPRVGGKR